MKNIYFYLIEFIVAVILVLLYYKLVETRKIKKYTKDNIPVDLKLLITSQNINVKKISYKKLMRIVALINAIDIGLILVITNVTKYFLLKLLIAIPCSFILLFVSYKLVGYILRKKGYGNNES